MRTLCPSGTKKLSAGAICGLFLRGKIAVQRAPLRFSGSTMPRIDR
jgi:hypothetical protein